MHVLPHEIAVDEKALEYASAFAHPREVIRHYIATVLGYPLPAELLEQLNRSPGIGKEDSCTVIHAYKEAVFLKTAPTE
jgi:hypothetical protein